MSWIVFYFDWKSIEPISQEFDTEGEADIFLIKLQTQGFFGWKEQSTGS